VEKSAALSFCADAKNSATFMKGGMTDVQFCSAAFCIIDFMGGFKAPDRETERRTQKKQKEITFQNGADGNIGSYFFITQSAIHSLIFLKGVVSYELSDLDPYGNCRGAGVLPWCCTGHPT
jgi:hypothetical protein